MRKKILSSLFAIGMIAVAFVMSCSKKDDPVAVTNVQLSDNEIVITGGGTATLTATILPENATNQAVTWASENENIATIDANGRVTAKNVGETTIRVTTRDGNKTATCQVKVIHPKANIAPSATHYITMLTQRPTTEKLKLKIEVANEADKAGVWIDLNNNGAKDTGEEITNFGGEQHYEFTSPTITLYGKVTFLNCGYNRFSQLDISHNTDLVELSSYDNPISTIDLTKNINLRKLTLTYANLTELDLSQNTKLVKLEFGGNRLKELNLNAQKELMELSIHYNQFTTLDVSQNTKLWYIRCHVNQIKGKGMDDLIASLPTLKTADWGSLYVKRETDNNEQNEITATQIKTAKDKNWQVFIIPQGANNWVIQ